MSPVTPQRADQIDRYYAKLKTLNEVLWEHRAPRPDIDAWLNNFPDDYSDPQSERLHALYLLTKFMYFGVREVRALLVALYRDVFRYPIIESIRADMGGSTDVPAIHRAFAANLAATKFVGLGNPSDSGAHLLYYFRQENRLSRRLFVHSHQLFDRSLSDPDVRLSDPNLKRIIFLDDFCGTGFQANQFSAKTLGVLADIGRRTGQVVETAYYSLFATEDGMRTVRAGSAFDRVQAVAELDDSYRCFGPTSRYFPSSETSISLEFAEAMATRFGRSLVPTDPLGYHDTQALLGFHHNVPDNTLPIIWYADEEERWTPIFRRYPKTY